MAKGMKGTIDNLTPLTDFLKRLKEAEKSNETIKITHDVFMKNGAITDIVWHTEIILEYDEYK